MASSDQQLVESTLHGDRAAFGELVERYSGLVRGTIMEVVRRADEVDDLPGRLLHRLPGAAPPAEARQLPVLAGAHLVQRRPEVAAPRPGLPNSRGRGRTPATLLSRRRERTWSTRGSTVDGDGLLLVNYKTGQKLFAAGGAEDGDGVLIVNSEAGKVLFAPLVPYIVAPLISRPWSTPGLMEPAEEASLSIPRRASRRTLIDSSREL